MDMSIYIVILLGGGGVEVYLLFLCTKHCRIMYVPTVHESLQIENWTLMVLDRGV
jgi:hypothetical protein